MGTGYREIQIEGRRYLAHHLAFFWVWGIWPNQIDHKNQARDDNRIENLRVATDSQNMANKTKDRRNKSGYKGVHFHASRRKWRAEICVAGHRRHIGYFKDAALAKAAYDKAAQEAHGEFARS